MRCFFATRDILRHSVGTVLAQRAGRCLGPVRPDRFERSFSTLTPGLGRLSRTPPRREQTLEPLTRRSSTRLPYPAPHGVSSRSMFGDCRAKGHFELDGRPQRASRNEPSISLHRPQTAQTSPCPECELLEQTCSSCELQRQKKMVLRRSHPDLPRSPVVGQFKDQAPLPLWKRLGFVKWQPGTR